MNTPLISVHPSESNVDRWIGVGAGLILVALVYVMWAVTMPFRALRETREFQFPE